MGLFHKKEKNDIIPDVSKLKFLVTNYSGRKSYVYINSKVDVPEGYSFVMGYNGKVTDRFDSGEHFFNYSTLPYTCRKLKIDKMVDGKQTDKFACQYYFVDRSLRAGQFKTYRKVQMGTKAYGIFNIHVYGMFAYKVLDIKEFMQSLLNEFDYIKTGEAEDIISSWVSDLVVETLEKKNFVITDVVNNSPIIANALSEAVSKLFSKAGLELVSLSIYKYGLPKQYQKESDEIIQKQLHPELSEKEQKVDEKVEALQASKSDSAEQTAAKGLDIFGGEATEKVQSAKDEEMKETQPSLKEESAKSGDNLQEKEDNKLTSNADVPKYIPFGNIKIMEKPYDAGELSKINNQPAGEGKETIKEKKFVDLDDGNYSGDSRQTKRCLNCGAENDIFAEKCTECGNKFSKGDDYDY